LNTEDAFVDMALRAWKLNIERTGQFFAGLSEEELLHEIAPGKNRLLYLWGHLTAVSDALIPLLGLGARLHPELDAMFISNRDRAVVKTLSGAELKAFGTRLTTHFGSDLANFPPRSGWTSTRPFQMKISRASLIEIDTPFY
jgi:hypothetical protein